MPAALALFRRVFTSVIMAVVLSAGGLMLSSPAHAADDTLQLLTPAQDQKLGSRTVAVSGTGTPGGLIGVATGTDQPLPDTIEVDEAGNWTTEITYPADYFAAQSITVTQSVGGDPAGEVQRWFTIPDPDVMFIDAPLDKQNLETRYPTISGRAPSSTVITATVSGEVAAVAYADEAGRFSVPLYLPPGEAGAVEVLLEGSFFDMPVQPKSLSVILPGSLPAPVVGFPVDTTVTGPTIVANGTATPGQIVYFWAGQTGAEDEGRNATAAVDSSGDWSLSLELAPGNYTGTAYLVSPQDPSLGTDVYEPLSYIADFQFNVQAPVATPTASPVGSQPRELPATGSSSDMLIGGAAVLLAFGVAMTLTVRLRSRSRATS